MAYSFNKEKHHHSLDDKPLMSVTTVLSVIAKPMLIQWAANMACDSIQSVMETGMPITLDVIKEARTAHRIKKEKAGDWGTALHLAIEELIATKKSASLD